ncbi:MAG: binding-protein-dependent transport system inner rane component [Pseudomonadota bacterium]|jgi:NitT/TauT family transport system permease protein
MPAAARGPEAASPGPVKRRRFPSEAALPWITTPLLVGTLILIWDSYVRMAGVSPLILPRPGAVWHAWIEMLGDRRAWHHTWMTVYATLTGFAYAATIGIVLGVLIARARWLELTLNPFIVATQVIPKVALVPLFVLWFGFGITSKVIVAAVLSFFPILTNTALGVKSIEEGHRDVMVSLNATRWQVFRRLELPSALPYIITGLEVGIVLAIIGAIVGEYLGGSSGLGHLLIARLNAFETDQMFAVLIHMSLLGFTFYFLIGALRRRLIPWHASARPRV